MRIDGKVTLVTGGAGGLGEVTARHLHARGSKVLVFGRNAERAMAIAHDLGDGAAFFAGDATSTPDVDAAIAAASEMGELRAVVTCAGGATAFARLISRDGTPHDFELFVDTLQLNLLTTFNTLRLAASAMSQLEPVDDDGQRGVCVLVSSIAGYEGQIGQVAYATAKAGLIGMALVAARDLAAHGIRVNCIAPGIIGTPAWDGTPQTLRDAVEASVPFPSRFGWPSEFAELVEHVISNNYLNGEVVRLDGSLRFSPK
jgi:NAD(P)-dependent dehydrogenase (short-subunit alcohol dehydrogenase family)